MGCPFHVDNADFQEIASYVEPGKFGIRINVESDGSVLATVSNKDVGIVEEPMPTETKFYYCPWCGKELQ